MLGRSIRLFTRQFIDTTADFFFPPHCIGCGRVEGLFCPDCQGSLSPAPSRTFEDGLLREQRATAIFEGPLRDAIHALKYEHQPRMAKVLAMRLAAEIKHSDWKPTLITAVPLHAARQKMRGYNQSALLAAQLSTLVGLPFSADAIRKIRDTRAQVGLNAVERRANIASAFEAVPALVGAQRMLLIDDVCTTGATLRECAAALVAAGAECVWGLTVASAPQRPDLSVQ